MRKFAFPALLAVLWLVFFAAWHSLPYVRPGTDVIYAAKEKNELQGRVFRAPLPDALPDAGRLIVFGNSKVLTGFIPDVFDQEVRPVIPGIYSVNMGKPDESRFVRDLEILARHRQLPSRIVLTLPWSTTARGPFLRDDEAVASTLFPFRRLPRDLVLFWALAPFHGGAAAFYRHAETAVINMTTNRGWYFIEGQSHFPGHRLPDDFSLASDTADRIDDPAFIPSGPEFAQLCKFADQQNVRYYIVPSYHRTGEMAPPPPQAASVAGRLRGYRNFTVLGPNYFLFPPRYFSDPVHLNPEGAKLYTRELARLLLSAPS